MDSIDLLNLILQQSISFKGPSIYDVPKKIRFLTLPLFSCVLMRLTHPPCGRSHAVDMKYTKLSWNG